MFITPWYRCICGKLHIMTYVGPNTVCTCGTKLYPKMFNRRLSDAK